MTHDGYCWGLQSAAGAGAGVGGLRPAIPFILFDDATKKYVVYDEAIRFLESLQNKIGMWQLSSHER